MENKAPDVLDSPGAPYLTALANTYGNAANYLAISHPSLPNYIALTSGSTHGVSEDWSPGVPGQPRTYALDVPSIFSQLPGGRSRSLAESMSKNCERMNNFPYLVRHNPEVYYTNLGSDCYELRHPVLSAPTPDLSAAFTSRRTECDQRHARRDDPGRRHRFLASFVPKLMATPQYRSGTTVIFITWDESEVRHGARTTCRWS